MYIWEENLMPLPNSSFRVSNKSAVIRSQMDTGRFRQRRRFTDDFETATLTFNMLNDEYSMFKSVWKYELLNGSNWFKMRLPVGDGNILTEVEVRFTKNYSASYKAHTNWSVSAPIEFKDYAAITTAELDQIRANNP